MGARVLTDGVAALGAFRLSSSTSGKFAEGSWGRVQFKEARKSGRCLSEPLISAYTALFSREEVYAIPSSLQERVPVASPSLNINDSIPDTYNAPPRPVPYDDPIFSQLQHDGLISRHDKILSHFHEESEPFINNNDNEAELQTEGKCKGDLKQSSRWKFHMMVFKEAT
ncbi:Zinc finger, C3HC4 type (RING finger) [Musa troglodytarum]|uniref:Zinc finger, C3HC4 type (RING finger) n=1 Tax=Musa troglodytarum TaxID=320322 RepID=A0A9E7HTU6_9LILI|nr:Zinc finger, C3HC4 type (RING finger) [Musa troglodytarum]